MWARRRRPSIYEHVLAHIEPGTPGLGEGGETLPDDDDVVAGSGGLRWAPGALEGTSSRYWGTPTDTGERADELHRALVELAARPGRRTRATVTSLFRAGAERSLMDALLERLRDRPPDDQIRLYAELRSILCQTSNREELKFAIALVGAFGEEQDAEIFRTLARHEEFTLYAAVALTSIVEDPVGELLGLLPDVSGWGASELSELLIRSDDDRVCGVLLRRGASIGDALTLAVECRLHEALAADEVDEELLRGAQSIIDDLAWSYSGPETLAGYPDAGPAVERFLELLAPRATSLDDLLTAAGIEGYLEAMTGEEQAGLDDLLGAPAPDEAEVRAHELAEAGLDDARIERIRGLCLEIVARPAWRDAVSAALESADEHERDKAIAAARRLGLPLRDYLTRKIEAHPNDSTLWYHLAFGGDAERIGEAVRLAERVLDLDALASGAALEYFGPADTEGPHQAAGFVLQELPRFPGVGERLLVAALDSPVIRHRLQALDALSRWPREPLQNNLRVAVERRLADPDEHVRASADAVLRGEPIPERRLDVEED